MIKIFELIAVTFFLFGMLIGCGNDSNSKTHTLRYKVTVEQKNGEENPVATIETLVTGTDSSYDDVYLPCGTRTVEFHAIFEYPSNTTATGYKFYWRENDIVGQFTELTPLNVVTMRGHSIIVTLNLCIANYFYMTAVDSNSGEESDRSGYVCVGEICPESFRTMASPTSEVSQ